MNLKISRLSVLLRIKAFVNGIFDRKIYLDVLKTGVNI